VAVIGAGGIGRHHANWWALEGAEVCAFAGTSEESVARTREALRGFCGFAGRGYTDVTAMLETERPDVVDVCSPAKCHYPHARRAIEAGCHVLCEKPFVYDPGLSREAILSQARELVILAAGKGLRLGVCTQYSVGARTFTRLWNERHPGQALVHYHGHLESPAKNRPPDPERVWVDLSPHLISVLLKLVPDGEVDWGTLRTTFQGYEAVAEFDFQRPAGEPVRAWIVTRNAVQPPLNVRHFKYNGYPFVVEGQHDASGVYWARIETPDGHHVEPDMMRVLIREFGQGHVTAAPEESLKNLDLMLRIMNAAKDL
jgi:predicted dehydrogenase